MKSAVLVIDVQSGLFDSSPRPYQADEVVQRINSITTQARAAGVPVIFIQSEHPGFLEYATDRWQLQSELTVQDGDIKIRKTLANAFFRPILKRRLNRWRLIT
jgi:nicotinamidase-related amidase